MLLLLPLGIGLLRLGLVPGGRKQNRSRHPECSLSVPYSTSPFRSLSALIRRTPFRSLSALIRTGPLGAYYAALGMPGEYRTAAPGPGSRERVTLWHERVNPEPMGKVERGDPTNQGPLAP